MKKSAVFLSFNHREGFGLPPVEAMSCGCYVIGYQGQAGKEYFKDEFSSTIPEGNIINFVEEIERIIKNFDAIKSSGKKASNFIHSNYYLENEKNEIIEIWKNILIQK